MSDLITLRPFFIPFSKFISSLKLRTCSVVISFFLFSQKEQSRCSMFEKSVPLINFCVFVSSRFNPVGKRSEVCFDSNRRESDMLVLI